MSAATILAWPGEWEQHIAEFTQPGGRTVQDATSPEFRRPARRRARSSARRIPRIPILMVWPESPAPFFEDDPRFQQALMSIAHASARAAGRGRRRHGFRARRTGVARLQLRADCRRRRSARGPLRQDPPGALRRVHSFRQSVFFARKLTGRVSQFSRGDERKVFRSRTGIVTASSSAMSRSSPTRCGSLRGSAPRCSLTSATTAGTATPALPGST